MISYYQIIIYEAGLISESESPNEEDRSHHCVNREKEPDVYVVKLSV